MKVALVAIVGYSNIGTELLMKIHDVAPGLPRQAGTTEGDRS
jgi:hypothetical protein